MKYPTYKIAKSEAIEPRQLTTELTASELAELCECAQTVAASASEVILDIYSSSAEIVAQIKKDQTPVTKADMASDERIIAGLKKHTRFPIVTEEHPLDISDRKDRKSVWLVDPLDGTQNFINRDGQFSVLISLLHFNTPVIGVVAIPQLNEIYYGYYRGGAFRKSQGCRPQAICHQHPERELKAVLSSLPSKGGREREEEFCSENGIEQQQMYRIGSSIKLAKLAEGEYDLTVRFDVLSEWDTAAADCLLSESACHLKDVLTNKPIAYNQRESLGLPGYMVIRSDYDFIKNKD